MPRSSAPSAAVLLSLLAAGCARSAGLEELDAVPADFPIELTGQTGKITRSDGAGQVAVDLVFESKPEAEAAWTALKARADAHHWKSQPPLPGPKGGKKEKWSVEAYLLPDTGRLELSCCPARADRRSLVLVSWWPAGGSPTP